MRSCTRLRAESRGFTLIEITFASVILALAIIGAFSLIVFSMASIHRNREMQYVNRLIETVMEETRNLSWQELLDEQAAHPSQTFDVNRAVPGADSSNTSDDLYGNGICEDVRQRVSQDDFLLPISDATGTIYIDDVAGETNLRKITVEVSYRPYKSSQTTKCTSVTYKSNQGVDGH